MFANNIGDKKSQRNYQRRKNKEIIDNLFRFYNVFVVSITRKFFGGSLTNFFKIFRKEQRKKIMASILKKFNGSQLLALYLVF